MKEAAEITFKPTTPNKDRLQQSSFRAAHLRAFLRLQKNMQPAVSVQNAGQLVHRLNVNTGHREPTLFLKASRLKIHN